MVNFLKRPLCDARGVVVHAENEGSDRKNIAVGEPLKHSCVLTGFVESLVHAGEVGGVDGLHSDEYPLAARSRNEVHEFLITQQIGTYLRNPMHLRTGGDNVA